MKVATFFLKGDRTVEEMFLDKPEPGDEQIEVKTEMVGVCRSDVAMFNGAFPSLPAWMQGHEGIGIVTKVGKFIEDVRIGDRVATCADGCFGDYFNADHRKYCQIDTLTPLNLLEPVACGMNIANRLLVNENFYDNLLIIGSGFLATVVYLSLLDAGPSGNIYYSGSFNHDLFKKAEFIHGPEPDREFDVVIDLTNRPETFNAAMVKNSGIFVFAADKGPNLNLDYFLWKSINILCPSPKSYSFFHSFINARMFVWKHEKKLKRFWTKGYHRDTELFEAFNDSLMRSHGFNRAWINF